MTNSMYPTSPFFPLADIIAWTLLTAGVWVFNFTIFLPLYLLLMWSANCRKNFFTFACNFILTRWYRDLIHYRRKVFELICNKKSKELGSASFRILEIGVGTGQNFEFYPENCPITFLDMNSECESYVRSKMKKDSKIKLEKFIIGSAENMSEICDNEYDAVVTTFLLCSVKDVDAVLKEIHRVLKKGGKYASLDHVAYPSNFFLPYMMQRAIVPLCRVYGDGCTPDRDILKNIKNAGFSQISYKTYYPYFMHFYFRAVLMGSCTK